MSNELKPCPFCGNNANIEKFIGMGMDSGDWITCDFCHRCFLWGDTKSVELWNTRPIEDALRAEIAAMERVVQAAVRAAIKLEKIWENSPKSMKNVVPEYYELLSAVREYQEQQKKED